MIVEVTKRSKLDRELYEVIYLAFPIYVSIAFLYAAHGPVSRKLFEPEKPFVKIWTTHSTKLLF